jgi:hypothetical protein
MVLREGLRENSQNIARSGPCAEPSDPATRATHKRGRRSPHGTDFVAFCGAKESPFAEQKATISNRRP